MSVLVGHLYSNTRRTVGILDLGGGSTQITFLPKSKVSHGVCLSNLKAYCKSNTLTVLDLSENDRDRSRNLHFLFRPVQPHISSLYTQVNNDSFLNLKVSDLKKIKTSIYFIL